MLPILATPPPPPAPTPAEVVASPAATAVDPADLLDWDIRDALFDRLANIPPDLWADLNTAAFARDATAFDQALLEHMRNRPAPRFFFAPHELPAYARFAQRNDTDLSGIVQRADWVVHDRRFPVMVNFERFTVTLPEEVDWIEPGGSDNPEFVHTLNRFSFWQDLAFAARITGDAEYVREICRQLAGWSSQHPHVVVGVDWHPLNALDLAGRTLNWTWSYFGVLGHDAWDGAANTLMLWKLAQHGEELSRQLEMRAEERLATNATVVMASGLHHLGLMFPELESAAAWEEQGRRVLWASSPAQLLPDGTHIEKSPNYAVLVLQQGLDVLHLDRLNGRGGLWGFDDLATLERAAKAGEQVLNPDGSLPAIGDTFRTRPRFLFSAAVLVGRAPMPAMVGHAAHDRHASDPATRAESGLPAHRRAGDVVASTPNLQQEVDLEAIWHALRRRAGLAPPRVPGYVGGRPLGHVLQRPEAHELWRFGPAAIEPYLSLPREGLAGDRGPAFGSPDGNIFVLRSRDQRTQMTIAFGVGEGMHSHRDLLAFELFAGGAEGQVLVAEPGPYKYDDSDARRRVISTPAHNAVSVNGESHRRVPPGHEEMLELHAFDVAEGAIMFGASHHAYRHLPGSPRITRHIWFDGADTFLIMDRVTAGAEVEAEMSLTLPAAAGPVEVDGDSVRTRHANGPNVLIRALLPYPLERAGSFITAVPVEDFREPAERITSTTHGREVVFVTLVRVEE